MLMTTTGITEMKPKNVEVIKTLCAVAYTDGNYLQGSWVDVSTCMTLVPLANTVVVNLDSTDRQTDRQTDRHADNQTTNSLDKKINA